MADSQVPQGRSAKPWWDAAGKKEAGERAQGLFKHFHDIDKDRLQSYTAYERLYTNRDIRGDGYLKAYSSAFQMENAEYSRVPLNVCKVMLDAAHARITRPAIRVEFLPSGGNFTLRRKAKQATQFIAHVQHASDLDEIDDRASHNGMLYGLGAVKTTPHPVIPEVVNECIHPRDIFIDPIEAITSGKPTHLYQRMFVSRSKLKKFFKGHGPSIDSAARLSDVTATDWATEETQLYDQVEVVEAWKLPSWVHPKTGKTSGDGRHIIFIDGHCIEFGKWERADFPFSFTRWKNDPTLGFFGVSLAEELIGLHFDINTSIIHTERAIEMMPKPFVMLPTGAEISEEELGNDFGIIIRFSDGAPAIHMPKVVPDDVVNYVNVQWQRALQVSRLVAMGMAEQAGHYAESGQAIKDIADIQNTELAPSFKNRERFLVRLAEQNLNGGSELNKRMVKAGEGPYRVVLRKNRNTVMDIDWSNFELDPKKDSYVVQALPASALGVTFGMRLANVKEMLGSMLISPSQGLRMLDVPDTESFGNLENAAYDAIELVCEAILDEGEDGFQQPEPSSDLRLGLKVAQKWLNYAKTIGVPDDRLNLLDDYLRQTQALIEAEQEATRAQAAGIETGFAGQPPARDITGMAPAATPDAQPQQGAPVQ